MFLTRQTECITKMCFQLGVASSLISGDLCTGEYRSAFCNFIWTYVRCHLQFDAMATHEASHVVSQTQSTVNSLNMYNRFLYCTKPAFFPWRSTILLDMLCIAFCKLPFRIYLMANTYKSTNCELYTRVTSFGCYCCM